MNPTDPLTQSQLEILQAVWELGAAGGTASEIWQATEATRQLARTTVLTQVQRLHKKGWLRRSTRKGTVVFRARCDRATAEQQLARRFVTDYFDGSTTGLVRSLLGEGKVDRDEIARLRELLDDAEQQR